MTVERYYGSVGDIQVFGVASVVANTSVPLDQEAAVQSVDFAATVVQVTLPDGSTSGTLSVPILDNQESEPLKVFQFTLTSVAGGIHSHETFMLTLCAYNCQIVCIILESLNHQD